MGFFDFLIPPLPFSSGDPLASLLGLTGGGGGGDISQAAGAIGNVLGGGGGGDKDKDNKQVVDMAKNYGLDQPESVFNQYRKKQMGMGGQTGGA